MPTDTRSKRDPRKVQTRLLFRSNSPGLTPSGTSTTRVTYQDPRVSSKKIPTSNVQSRFQYADFDDDIFADGKDFAVVLPSWPLSTGTGQTSRGKSFIAASSSVQRGSRPREIPVNKADSEPLDEEELGIVTEKPQKRPAFLRDGSESPLRNPARAIVKNGVAHTPKKSNVDSSSPKKQRTPLTRNFIAGGYLDPRPSASPRYKNPKKNRAKDDTFISRKSKEREVVILSSDEDAGGDESDGSVQNQQSPSLQAKEYGGNEETKKTPLNLKRRTAPTSDEDEEPIRSSPAKRRKQLRPAKGTTEEVDSESSLPTRVPNRTPRRSDQQTHDAKASETRKGKDDPKRLTRRTNTPKKHRTEKQKKLELLKRKRAGEKIDELTESSSDVEEVERAAYDTDSDLVALSVFDDEELVEGIEEVRQSLRPNVRNQDDDSFVVEDDSEPLGVPFHSMHEIPLEFTHQAHKPLKEHFKDVIEWMVQTKINPSFNRRDPIYLQAFRKLEPEARGLAQSKFSSAAWSEDFTRALWARPDFHEERIGAGDEGEGRKCDACGRSNHPAKFKVQLRGNSYYKETLEEVDKEECEGSEDGNESGNESVNSKGVKLLSQDTIYYLGRFCRANAERAHSLIHWKHALNEWVMQTLENQGFLDPQKLAERIKWNQRKLNTYANQIVDEWTVNGEIKSLYKDFKNNLEAARNGKQDRWNA